MKIISTPKGCLLVLLAASLNFTDSALAASVTAASGGGSISADTAANALTPAWTSLGSIAIAESNNTRGDIGGGTIVLKSPAGFEFNTNVVPNINYTSGRNITAATVAYTDATTLTITLTVTGTDATDTVTIGSGSMTRVQVRPTVGTPLASGRLYRPTTDGGTAVIIGVTSSEDVIGSGGTSFGNLRAVAGAARQLALQTVLPVAMTAGDLFSPSPVLLVQDQFGNTRNTANGSADNASVVTVARGLGSGALQGTTNETAANGVVTFDNLTQTKAGTITMIFSCGSLTNVVSDNIEVSPAAGDRLVFTTQPVGGTYGTLLTTQPVVRARDRFGNDSILGLPASRIVTVAISSGTGSLLGNNALDIGTAAGNGTIILTNLQTSTAGAGKQLTATASGMTNGVSSSFNVTPAMVEGSITASNKVYNGTTAAAIATRTLTGVLGNDQVSLAGGTATFATKDVGTGKLVTATGLTLSDVQAANYQLASTTATDSANITVAPLGVRADNLNRIYGATNPTLTASYLGFVGGETLATSGVTGKPGLNTTAQTNSPVGNHVITITPGNLAAQNYSFSFTNGTLAVAKAPLQVTAESLWRAFGATNPVFAFVYTGFVLGENSNVLSGSPSATTSAAINSPVGDYAIVPAAGSLTAANYTFSFVDGTLSVLPAGTLFADSFSRSTNPGPLTPWVVRAGNWSVTGGALAGGTNALGSYGYAFLTNVWTDYTAKALIRFPTGAFGGGLAARLNAATGARYAAWIYPEGSLGGSSVIKLLKYQDWTGFTMVQQANLPGVGTNWHTLKLIMRGNRIAAHYDGALMLDWMDPDALPFLNGGIDLEMWTSDTAYALTADDVLVSLPSAVAVSNDTYTVRSAGTLTVTAPGVLSNDTAEMGSMTSTLVSGPAHGTLSLSTNGGFTYFPIASYTGNDSFTYRAQDGYSTSSATTVTIAITPNRAPIATNDSFTLMANTTLSVPAAGILTNDSDADGDSLTAILVTGPTKGMLSLNSYGGFSYVPNANYVGSDSFTYRASDGMSNSGLATANISVTAFTPLFNEAFTQTTLSPWVVQAGNWSVNGAVLQGETNSPNTYAYVYLTNQWSDYTASARVQLSVGGYGGGISGRLNPATGARYAAWIYPEGSSGGSSVLKLLKFQNWTDFATVQQASLPGVGTNWHTLKLAMQGNRVSVSYDGALLLNWTDLELQPLLNGGICLDRWTSVTLWALMAEDVVVNAIRNILSTNDSYSMQMAGSLTVPPLGVLTNDFCEMGGLTTVLVDNPLYGVVTLNTNGGFIYTPVVSYSGVDTFSYSATDGVNTSSPTTVTITILPNRAPVATNDSYPLTMNATLTVPAPGVLTNDSDPDGNPLRALLVSGPTHGLLSFSTNGGFSYAPTIGYTGPDSFTYWASDDLTNSGLAVVNFTVAAPGTLFADDFTRTNLPAALTPWIVRGGSWAVSGGLLLAGTNFLSTYGNAYLTNVWTDYEAQARLQLPTGAYGGGLAGRLNSATGARYVAWIYPEGSAGGSSAWKLLKFQNWESFTVLQGGSLGGVGTNWHALKLTFQGNRIDLRYDGLLLTSMSDPAPYLSGGLGLDLWTANTTYVMSADDIQVTALAPDVSATAFVIAPNVTDRTMKITFQGAPGGLYLVQATTNLAVPAAWVTVSTNVAGGNGLWTFTDSLTNLPVRFYRSARP